MAGPAFDTGQFPALANFFGTGRLMFRSDLSLPIVQKGSMDSGNGDFSGINLFNSSSSAPTTAEVSFYQPSGALAAPTLNSCTPLVGWTE